MSVFPAKINADDGLCETDSYSINFIFLAFKIRRTTFKDQLIIRFHSINCYILFYIYRLQKYNFKYNFYINNVSDMFNIFIFYGHKLHTDVW